MEARPFHGDGGLPRHDLRTQEIGATVAAPGFRHRERDGAQRLFATDERRDHP
jgi:hypothetical protein